LDHFFIVTAAKAIAKTSPIPAVATEAKNKTPRPTAIYLSVFVSKLPSASPFATYLDVSEF
jgi:hypothetical protein